MVIIGVTIGITLILIDQALRKTRKFRVYVMPTAVGIYLPLTLSVPILIGGVINLLAGRISLVKSASIECGVLLSSGLIAGESVMGIIIAMLIVGGIKLPISVIGGNFIPILALLSIISILSWISLKEIR